MSGNIVTTLNHEALTRLALNWLKRSNSAGGHGCQIALGECMSGWDGERPDAIGFRRTSVGHPRDGSVVVEAKASRADFLADKKKPHRSENGMGNWRYFICPEGLISPDELPERWGLLWVTGKGHIKVMAGAALAYRSGSFVAARESDAEWRHEANQEREQFLLVRVLMHIGDPHVLHENMRGAFRERTRLAEKCNQTTKRLMDLRSEISQAIRAGRIQKDWRGAA